MEQGDSRALTAHGRKRLKTASPRVVFLLTVLFGLLISSTCLAASKVVYVPQPNVSTFAIGSASYTFTLSGACNPVTPTNANVTVQPLHGTLSISSGSIPYAECPGQSLPGAVIYYTWTATNGSPGSGSDAFHVHFSSTQGTLDYDVFLFMGTYGKELGDKHPATPTFGGVCQDCGGAGNGNAPDDAPGTLSTDGQLYAGEPAGGGLGNTAGARPSVTRSLRARNPIQVATGNVFYSYTDYTTAGPNPLSFTRYYNSQGSIDSFAVDLVGTSAVNHNWRSNYDGYVDELTSNVVQVERPDGQVLSFFLVGSAWTSDTDVDYTLTHSGSTWTLTAPDDTVETYTTSSAVLGGVAIASSHLTSITSRNGYTRTLNYTGETLTSVTDSYGRTLSFAYNADGTMASITTPDNTTIAYSYTAGPLADLVATGQQLASVTFPTSPAQTITYNYADSSLPWALTSVTDEDGNAYESWTYDSTGRGLTNQLGGGAGLTTMTYGTNTATVTNALGVTDSYTFTTLQNVPKVAAISRAKTATTAAATEAMTYDTNGYIATRTDWNGNKASFTNNAHGMPTSLNEASGSSIARTVTVAYDTKFIHLPDTITSAGVTRSYTYDGSGNPLTVTLTDTTTTSAPYATKGQARTTTFTWSSFLPASTKTPNGNTTSFGYDGTGALTSITDALSHVTNITMHTGGGLPQVIVDPNNVTTTLTYDPRQRLMASAIATRAGTLTTSFAYDPAGNLTRTTWPDGSFIANTYDAAHRLSKATDALGNAVSLTPDALSDITAVSVSGSSGTVTAQHSGTFDALGRLLVDTAGAGQTTTVTHDKNGNALTVADGLNHTTTNTFDALNRLATSTDANSGVTTLTYDAHDRITGVKDANGNPTSYVIDGFGEAIGQTSPDTGAQAYHFDGDGNLLQKVDAAGVTANMTYDALDRLLTRAFPADATQNATYTYDASSDSSGFPVGRLATRADATGTTAFDYDERGNVLSAKSSGAPGGANLTTSYAYDKASRVSTITHPSGLVITYSRDVQGNVSGVAATLPGASSSTTMASLQTLPFGPDYAATLGNGVTESRAYDLDYRMTNVTATGTAGALENLTYTLDNANNVNAIADAVHAANSQTLAYDIVNRLIGATSGTGGYGSLAWVYDKVGNRTSQTAGSTTTTYAYASGSNRLASIISGGTTTTVATNANGNITSIPPANAGSAAIFAYNVANRLSSVTGSPTAASFLYDDWGRRFSKTDTGGSTTTYAYGATGTLLEETTASNVTDYIYVNGRLLGTFVPTPSSSATGGAADSGEVGSLPRFLKGHRGGLKLGVASLARTRTDFGKGGVLILVAALLLAAIGWLLSDKRRVVSALTPFALGLVFAACSGGNSGGGETSDAAADAAEKRDGESAVKDGGVHDAGLDATVSHDGGSDARRDAEATVADGGNDAGQVVTEHLYYLHTDHLGTPQLATDAAQNVVWSATYQPYGMTDDTTGSITQNLRLPGQYADSETGFNYNGFRDYMPNVGRYLEADPIGLRGGMNAYAYAGGNPMKYTDRHGRQLAPGQTFFGMTPQEMQQEGQIAQAKAQWGGEFPPDLALYYWIANANSLTPEQVNELTEYLDQVDNFAKDAGAASLLFGQPEFSFAFGVTSYCASSAKNLLRLNLNGQASDVANDQIARALKEEDLWVILQAARNLFVGEAY